MAAFREKASINYKRIDIRMKAEEITHINFGNKRQNGGVQVQLFE